MQVQAFVSSIVSICLVLSSTFLLIALAACKHTPSPDVMATVNSKDILRSDLDKAYNTYKLAEGGPAGAQPRNRQILSDSISCAS